MTTPTDVSPTIAQQPLAVAAIPTPPPLYAGDHCAGIVYQPGAPLGRLDIGFDPEPRTHADTIARVSTLIAHLMAYRAALRAVQRRYGEGRS